MHRVDLSFCYCHFSNFPECLYERMLGRLMFEICGAIALLFLLSLILDLASLLLVSFLRVRVGTVTDRPVFRHFQGMYHTVLCRQHVNVPRHSLRQRLRETCQTNDCTRTRRRSTNKYPCCCKDLLWMLQRKLLGVPAVVCIHSCLSEQPRKCFGCRSAIHKKS